MQKTTAPEPPELAKRQSIIEHARKMNRIGLNQGTAGNISLRHGEGMLITPTSLPYDRMVPDDIVLLTLADGKAQGRHAPSSEWRIHRDILLSRPDMNAVVHAHPTYATALAIMNMEIPPIHYMIAFAGGPSIRVAPYAIFGSEELSRHALVALQGRNACLLEHHGMIAAAATLAGALWLAVEVEALARQYHLCLALGRPVRLLTEAQIEAVGRKVGSYGAR